MKVIKESGTLSLELNGTKHTLRVDFRAIMNIQEDLGYGIVPLTVKFLHKDYGLKEQAIVIYHCLISASPTIKPTKDSVAEEIFKHGISDSEITKAISAICNFALSAGKDEEEDTGGDKKKEKTITKNQ